MIYAGKKFAAVQTGRRTVSVTCDHCQTVYFYELVRQGKGAASAPYFIGQGAARKRADKAAAQDLRKRLEQDSELVPCPSCHWINDSLVNGYRRMRCRWMTGAIVLSSIVILAVVFITLAVQPHQNFEVDWPYQAGWSIGAVAVFVGLALGLRRMIWNRIRPNANFPAPPKLPPGTPPGWTEEQLKRAPSDDDGKYVAPDESNSMFPDWALFRAGQLLFPRSCCECLAPSTTVYSQIFAVNNNAKIKPPLCKECASRLKLNWFLAALGTLAATLLLSFALVMVMSVKADARIPLILIFGLFGSLVAIAIIPNAFCQPYRLKVVDAQRALFRIRFKNEQFTEIIRHASDQIEKHSIRINRPASTPPPTRLPPRPRR